MGATREGYEDRSPQGSYHLPASLSGCGGGAPGRCPASRSERANPRSGRGRGDPLVYAGRHGQGGALPISVLLTDLVVGGAARREQLPTAAGKEIGYAEELGTSSCAAFFGRGYLQTLEGLELLSVSVDLSGARREESMGHGAALLTEAARYWRGERALGASGQLARACEALSRAEMLVLVDVCVTCARNFEGSEPPKPPKPLKPPEPSSSLDGTGGVSMTGEGSNRPSNITQAPIGGRVAEWETVIYDGKGLVDAGKIKEARLECYRRAVDAVIGVLKLPMVVAEAKAEEEEVATYMRK